MSVTFWCSLDHGFGSARRWRGVVEFYIPVTDNTVLARSSRGAQLALGV